MSSKVKAKDLDAGAASNGQALAYNSTSGEWEPQDRGRDWTSVSLKTEADDGNTMAPDILHLFVGTAGAGLKLPATTGLAVGTVVYVRQASTFRLMVSVDGGSDIMLGAGADYSGETAYPLGLRDTTTFFKYIGNLGAPTWLILPQEEDVRLQVPVQLTTVEALPAYTASGTGPDRILTCNTNVELVVDGVAALVGLPVLIRHGSATEDNKVYHVLDDGDAGVSPWIVRPAPYWSLANHVIAGTTVSVAQGDTMAGKTVTVLAGVPVGSHTTDLLVSTPGPSLTITSSGTISPSIGDVVQVRTSTDGAVTVTLPAITAGNVTQTIILKDIENAAGANNITINTTSTDTIDLAAFKTLSTNGDSITLMSDGVPSGAGNWMII